MKTSPRRGRFVSIVALAGVWFALATPSLARVELTLDAATLTQFLAAVTPSTLTYPLPAGGQIDLALSDLRVDGFDPAAGGGKGHVLGSLRLGIPALGLEFPLRPRLSVAVETDASGPVCVLRFESLSVPLPATGALDVSSLLPVYRVPAQAGWTVSLRQGDVRVESRLLDAKLGADGIRFGFDLDLAPAR